MGTNICRGSYPTRMASATTKSKGSKSYQKLRQQEMKALLDKLFPSQLGEYDYLDLQRSPSPEIELVGEQLLMEVDEMELSLEAQLTKSMYDIYYDEDEDGEASRTIASTAAALEQDKAVQGKEREFAFQYLWR